jgi:CelD/BcsL family acetyltransferase involved in cellulose biosynthesis
VVHDGSEVKCLAKRNLMSTEFMDFIKHLGERGLVTKIETELEIERIRELEALESLKEDWNTLLEKNETKTIELTYEWQITYWKHFNEHSELFVLVVKEAGSIVAIAPLRLTYTKKFGLRIRTLEFIAAKESNYQDFIVGDNGEKILEHIANYLISSRDSWDILDLTHVPETSTTAHFFLNELDDSLLRRVADVEACIFLKVDKTWEEYATNSKKARQKVNYRVRRLTRHGEIDYFHCSSREQICDNLQAFFELHRKRWNPTTTPSQFIDDRLCQFYLEVTPQLLLEGQVDLFVLRLEGSPVALLYSFLFGRNCLIQLVAHDTEYSKSSPSQVMHELFVKQAFADGIKVIDFGYYHPYKEYWADRFKNRVNIQVYPKRISAYYIYILTKVITSLRANLKQVTPLRQFIRYIRRRIRSLSGACQQGTR